MSRGVDDSSSYGRALTTLCRERQTKREDNFKNSELRFCRRITKTESDNFVINTKDIIYL